MLLARHFAARMADELDRDEGIHFSHQAEASLVQYPWYGNIRELKNVIERAVYKAKSAVIENIDFDPFDSPYPLEDKKENLSSAHGQEASSEKADLLSGQPFTEAVQEFEQGLIKEALVRVRYNQKKAAALLSLSYDQFRGLYRQYQKKDD